MPSRPRYVAVHKQTRIMYPKEGSFDCVDDAVEFAKRRDPSVLAWSFGAVEPWDQRRRARALPVELKNAIRQLWDAVGATEPDHVVQTEVITPPPPDSPSEPSKGPNTSDIPPPPPVPADAVPVPAGTIPAGPKSVRESEERISEPEHITVSPVVPPPPDPDKPKKTPAEKKKKRRRRRKSDDDA